MRGYIIEPVDIPALRWLIFLARNTQKLPLWQVHCLGYWMSAMEVGGGGEKKVVKDSVVFGEKSWNFNSMFRIGLMKEAFEPLREG